VISLDRLGLEKVYVQAKRWQNTVGSPEVQAFYGAQQAIDFARSVERVVLVDGEKLASLMIENEVGVSLRPVKIPKLDSDYLRSSLVCRLAIVRSMSLPREYVTAMPMAWASTPMA
jgi:restriction endonuclease Mrr